MERGEEKGEKQKENITIMKITFFIPIATHLRA